MKRMLAFGLCMAGLALPALAETPPPAPETFAAGTIGEAQAGLLGSARVYLPKDAVRGAVFLFSDADGWGADEEAAALKMQGEGGIVVGVDTSRLFPALEKDAADECVYLVADIEDLSHRIQRGLGTADYFSPIVAGVGSAGALGLAIAAQTPDATIGHTVAVDPLLALPLAKPLCTDAPRAVQAGGTVYGLAEGDLTDPVDVYFTSAADPASRAHVAALQAQGFTIKSKDVGTAPFAALQARLDHLLAPRAEADDPLADLPLIELPARPQHGVMAIILSGDGGWRDIDKSVGEALQKQGVPTVGVDSLRYFWSRKSPEQTAADLTRIIDNYSELWDVSRVLLIGYSFGADALPGAYNRLPAMQKAQVAEISLLALSEQADYEISVGAFLGTGSGEGSTLTEVAAIKPSLVQCIYGEEEDDSACPKLQGSGVEVIRTTGGHHFDGDYEALANRILEGLKRHTARSALPIAEK